MLSVCKGNEAKTQTEGGGGRRHATSMGRGVVGCAVVLLASAADTTPLFGPAAGGSTVTIADPCVNATCQFSGDGGH